MSPWDGIPRAYTPGKTLKVKVRGDPGSKVGLAAVDNAIYLLNKDRLTQSKVCVRRKRKEKKKKDRINSDLFLFVLSPFVTRSWTWWRRQTLAAPKEGEKTPSWCSQMPDCCSAPVVALKPTSDRVTSPSPR